MKQQLKDRGGNKALVVIDVQNGVVADGHDVNGVLSRIASLIAHAKSCEIPVVFVQHESDDLVPDTDSWQIRSEIAPTGAEPVIHKRFGDAFIETNFEETLADLGVGHLVITGAQTDACVRSTLVGALRDGYDVTLVSDAHTTSDWEYRGVESKAVDTIARFNVEAGFIDYPNTESYVTDTDAVLSW